MNKQQKLETAITMVAGRQAISTLTADEMSYVKERGFDPGSPHPVVLSVIHNEGDQAEADRISSILAKLPNDSYSHIICNILKTPDHE